MAEPIMVKARAIAPDSQTGERTRSKWSKLMLQKGWAKYSSREWIRAKSMRYENVGVLIVGGQSHQGNKLNFDSGEDGRDVVYWGKYARILKRIPPEQRFMQRAYDETKGNQYAAGVYKLQKEVEAYNG